MTPELRITVLMENTAREGLEAEHGLSFFLEYRGRCFLLDAGSSGRFADNAQKLGVDLDGVELAALSHGHYDHADGLRAFLPSMTGPRCIYGPRRGGLLLQVGRLPQICGHPSGDLGGLPGPLRAGGWAVPPLPRGPGWRRRPSGAGPLPAGSPICCARWGRTGSCPTTFPTSSPWCWRPGGGWWCSTPAAMGVW